MDSRWQQFAVYLQDPRTWLASLPDFLQQKDTAGPYQGHALGERAACIPAPLGLPVRSTGRQSHTGLSASCEGVDGAIWGLAEAEQRMWQLRFIDCSL